MTVINIHTDGACPNVQDKSNRVAGWAWVDDNSGTQMSGVKEGETHIWGEVYAVYSHLKFLRDCKFKDVELHVTTDSKYVINGFDNLNRGKILTSHYAVWKRVKSIMEDLNIKVYTHKVKSHKKVDSDPLNDLVDKLAVDAVMNYKRNK